MAQIMHTLGGHYTIRWGTDQTQYVNFDTPIFGLSATNLDQTKEQVATKTVGPTQSTSTQPKDHDELEENYQATDAVIAGSKDTMGARERKMTQLQLHKRHGHIGYHESCDICRQVRASLRRVYKKVDPYIETRPGYAFSADSITWSDRSRYGNKYTIVFRCVACGYFEVIHLWQRSDATQEIERMVLRIRKDPLLSNRDYPMISQLRLDPAGEWRDDNKEFTSMIERVGITVSWSSPHDKRSNAHAENSVRQIEMTTKCIMLERRLPIEFWEDATNQAVILRNLYGRKCDIKSMDGDVQRPLERISGGRISRRQCDHRLHHFIMVGTVCMVSIPHTKGSDIKNIARSRWGIALKMVGGDLPLFECPFTGAHFRSKSYVIHELQTGQSYFDYLGIEPPPLPRACFPRAGDREEPLDAIVELENFGSVNDMESKASPNQAFLKSVETTIDGRHEATRRPRVTLVDKNGRVYDHNGDGIIKPTRNIIQHLIDSGITSQLDEPNDPLQRAIDLLQYRPKTFIGHDVYKLFKGFGVAHGKVIDQDFDKSGKPLWGVTYDDGVYEDYTRMDMENYCIRQIHGTNTNPKTSTSHDQKVPLQGSESITNKETPPPCTTNPEPQAPKTNAMDDPCTKVDFDNDHDAQFYTTKDSDTFFTICEAMGLPKAQQRLYYDWINIQGYGHRRPKGSPTIKPLGGVRFVHPWGGGRMTKFNPGNKFPIPKGKSWQAMVDQHAQRANEKNKEHINACLCQLEHDCIVHQEYARTKEHRNDEDQKGIFARLASKILDEKTGKILPPNTVKQAMSRPDSKEWLKAIKIELDALDELNVLSHDHKIEDLRNMGITQSIVPMRMIFDVVYNPDGTFKKLKARNVVQGHPGNMKYGEHFWATYSASPNTSSSRLLQALVAGRGYVRLAWDVCTTYLWAECDENERIPLRYPKGLRHMDPTTGEELYALLNRNLYGMPQANRRFCRLRDAWILEEFNKNGWKVTKLRADPCMFMYISPKGKKSFTIIHTDDCDCASEVGEDAMYIASKFDSRFKIKMCDESFMLGLKRTISKDIHGTTMVELTQPDFVENLYLTYKDHCPKRCPSTPFPETIFLHMSNDPPTKQEQDEILKLGYQSVVGSLLWASRNTYPEIAYGVNLLCRVMSQPSHQAWKCATHMVGYLYGQRHRGIRFKSDGNSTPICYYDSSHKQDPHDSKAQWGFIIMLFDGPILWGSKKHNHVGISSSHNEYMALSQASKNVMWIRKLLVEMGFGEMVDAPTPILGDNKQANMLSREDLVTPGNRFIRIEYHYAKECIELQETCTRYVDTLTNIADIFTKPLSRQYIQRLRPTITGYGEGVPEPQPPPRE